MTFITITENFPAKLKCLLSIFVIFKCFSILSWVLELFLKIVVFWHLHILISGCRGSYEICFSLLLWEFSTCFSRIEVGLDRFKRYVKLVCYTRIRNISWSVLVLQLAHYNVFFFFPAWKKKKKRNSCCTVISINILSVGTLAFLERVWIEVKTLMKTSRETDKDQKMKVKYCLELTM